MPHRFLLGNVNRTSRVVTAQTNVLRFGAQKRSRFMSYAMHAAWKYRSMGWGNALALRPPVAEWSIATAEVPDSSITPLSLRVRHPIFLV
jgi:hypothetical protein